MADTIITTPSANDSGAAGWAVAVVVLAVVLIGAFVWFQSAAPMAKPDTNINVTLPEGIGTGEGGAGGAVK